MPGKLHLIYIGTHIHYESFELPQDYDQIPDYIKEIIEKLAENEAKKEENKCKAQSTDNSDDTPSLNPDDDESQDEALAESCNENTKMILAKIDKQVTDFAVKILDKPGFTMRLIVVESLVSPFPDGDKELVQPGDFMIEVTPTTRNRDMKNGITNSLDISYKDKAIVFVGKLLSDSVTVEYYSIEDKQTLDLLVESPNELFKDVFDAFKQLGFSEEKAWFSTRSFVHVMHRSYKSSGKGNGINPTLPKELLQHELEQIYLPACEGEHFPGMDLYEDSDDEQDSDYDYDDDSDDFEDEGVVEDMISEDLEDNSEYYADADNEYEADEFETDDDEDDEYYDYDDFTDDQYESGTDEMMDGSDEDQNDDKDNKAKEDDDNNDEEETMRKLMIAYEEYIKKMPEFDCYIVIL